MGTGYHPESLVRTDRHTQKLDKFFLLSSQAPTSNSSPAAVAQQGSESREEESHAQARPARSSAEQQGGPSAEGGSTENVQRASKRPRQEQSDAFLIAAARERVQMEAHSGIQQSAVTISFVTSMINPPGVQLQIERD